MPRRIISSAPVSDSGGSGAIPGEAVNPGQNNKPLAVETVEGRWAANCLLRDLAGESGILERVQDFFIIEITDDFKCLGILFGRVFLHAGN